jgi:hypothetical protein
MRDTASSGANRRGQSSYIRCLSAFILLESGSGLEDTGDRAVIVFGGIIRMWLGGGGGNPINLRMPKKSYRKVLVPQRQTLGWKSAEGRSNNLDSTALG